MNRNPLLRLLRSNQCGMLEIQHFRVLDIVLDTYCCIFRYLLKSENL